MNAKTTFELTPSNKFLSRGRFRSSFNVCNELLETEQKLRVAAENANKEKDRILEAIIHDLRNPLNVILGWSRRARGKIGDTKSDEAFMHIEEQVRIQANLIDDILDLVKSASGTLRLELKPLDLNLVVENSISSIQLLAEEKGIYIEQMLAGNEAIVLGDSDRLRRIVGNLLINAIKFTPRGGKISVSVCVEEPFVRLKVLDSGCGITKEFLPKVFTRFEQDPRSSSSSHVGTGLGLAIVKRLVEMHGGRVAAKSKGVGAGAEFTVTLQSDNNY